MPTTPLPGNRHSPAHAGRLRSRPGASRRPSIRVRRLTSLREFDELAPIWAEVTRESGQSSPFLSHDWFACCWRTAGPRRQREVWIVEDDAGPLAFVPLVRWRTTVRGLPVRVLRFLDSPDTPFVDLPAVGRGEDVIATVLDTLATDGEWDLLTIAKVPPDAKALTALVPALAPRFPWRVAARDQAPFVRASGTWEEFFRRKTQRFRKTCRHIENKLRRAGTIGLEEYRQVDPDGPVFAEMMEVSMQSWKGPRGLAMATMQGMPRFFRELTARASMNGWLHLWVLRLDGRPIATEYQLTADGRVHALRADFDLSQSELSPGAYLNQHIVSSLFDRTAIEEYDMGPGLNEYKLRWATGSREVITLDIYAPTVYGHFLHGVETRLVPLVRRLRTRSTSA